MYNPWNQPNTAFVVREAIGIWSERFWNMLRGRPYIWSTPRPPYYRYSKYKVSYEELEALRKTWSKHLPEISHFLGPSEEKSDAS